MAKVKATGTCHICGVDGRLTYEHIPPRAAFNDRTVTLGNLELWLRLGETWAGQEGRKQQRGAGGFTLCEHCNNKTGAWYADEYGKWAKSALPIIAKMPKRAGVAAVTIENCYPLRFVKQAVAMLLSVNSPAFSETHPYLRKFLLDKDQRGLPELFSLYLTLVDGALARGSGLSGEMNLATGQSQIMTEGAHAPFAILMILGEHLPRAGRIDHLAAYGYEEARTLDLDLPRGSIATPYPGDYRFHHELRKIDRTAVKS